VSQDVSIPYLVILTGPSRAGKTSLAAELSKALPSRPLHIEADTYLPKAYVDHSWYAANQERLALALHRSVLSWIQAGYSVILDGSLPQAPQLRARCLQILEEVPRVIVGVVCPPDELTRRAVATARSPSWCLQTLSTFGAGIELSVQVDTSELTLEQCIQRVAACVPARSSTT
jgi:chloramphenicol 3-O phosphotransferase